jgi:hypothetical protein
MGLVASKSRFLILEPVTTTSFIESAGVAAFWPEAGPITVNAMAVVPTIRIIFGSRMSRSPNRLPRTRMREFYAAHCDSASGVQFVTAGGRSQCGRARPVAGNAGRIRSS